MQRLHVSNQLHNLEALGLWRRVTIGTLRDLPYDLSARQMGILLTVYLKNPPHTVKSLSEELGISKPAICRAIDALSALELIKRKRDEADKRNVFVQRTLQGTHFLADFAEVIKTGIGESA